MIVGIHQPNYLPWLGYFRKIALCDTFVFFDHAQLPGGQSFVTCNSIKAADGSLQLAVPVSGKKSFPAIADTRIAHAKWVRKHLRTLYFNYSHSPWKSLIDDELGVILKARHEYLADMNIALIQSLSRIMGLNSVRFLRATEMNLSANTAQSIPEILEKLHTTIYLTGSGSGMRRYLDKDDLMQRGIDTHFVSSEFPEYPQKFRYFIPNLSIVDALLNVGPIETARILKSGQPDLGKSEATH